MAEQRDDIEVIDENSDHKTKLLLIMISVLLLAVVALTAVMLMGGEDTATPAQSSAEDSVKKTPIYYSINAPFIVNFSEQSNGAVRYMQVKMKVMARDQQVIDNFTFHLPAIQHEMLMLLYSQNYDELQTSEGTKALQQACLETINRVLKSETSLENELEAVYFTSFIMQ